MSEIIPMRLTRTLTYPLLLLILLAGLTLRVWNVNFDRGIGSHPDERSTACFYAPTIGLPASWDEFWDAAHSPLNPLRSLDGKDFRHYTYGHFPLYLGVAFGNLLHVVAPLAEKIGLPSAWSALMARADRDCDALAVAGRLVIAGMDTLTILLLYLLTRRIYGRGAGLLAATFYAFTAQAIQLSHFFAMDPASTTFTVLALLGAVMMWQERTWRAALVTGIGAGLAIASKFSALPILIVPFVAGVMVIWDDLQQSQRTGQPVDGRTQFAAVLGMPLALLVAVVCFCVTSPYAILDYQHFIQATLVEQGAMVRGVADMPFTRQYRNTTPYLYFIRQQLQWGLGWPLGLVTATGVLYALGHLLYSLFAVLYTWLAQTLGRTGRKWLSRESVALVIIWSWVLPYFGITGAFLAKFNRYMSPLLPFVLLFTVGLIMRLWQRVDRETGRQGERKTGGEGDKEIEDQQNISLSPPPLVSLSWVKRGLAVILGIIGVAGGLFWALAYVNGVYSHEHTWITASRWIYQNVPRDSVILWEQWDDPLPKGIPNEPGMDMGSTGLRNIDWGPYEEDTPEKYAKLKEALRGATYVAYSSKRIYDSVDELPERYPMTTRYYQAMWNGELGFELAQEVTSPPRLFGWSFDDRHADESWSLYDHPQVTIFKKVRELSDAEYDALFAGTWEKAVPWYRGKDSPLSPLLNLLGLGNSQESADRGLINTLLAVVTGKESAPPPPDAQNRKNLMLDRPLAELPVVDNYRWNRVASTNTMVGVIWWWLVLSLLGWAAWPLAFYLCRPLRDRGYWLSRTLGWLLAGWLLWILASLGWAINSVVNAWLTLIILGLFGGAAALAQWGELRTFLRRHWARLLAGEALFALAYVAFVLIRMANPDLWQPWFGGEKFMEFAFLNGILRSPYFPPVDPHFAGGFINYYYFGLYLVAYLIKLTGIYAEVAFNLAIPTLFALTVLNSFAIAYSAYRNTKYEIGNGQNGTTQEIIAIGAMVDDNHAARRAGYAAFFVALLAPLFVTVMGNLDGFAQLVRNLAQISGSQFQSAFSPIQTTASAVVGLGAVLARQQALPNYDFWGPSRVIPATINEFPYWSFLFADLHAHVIGIPLALLFLGFTFVLLADYAFDWQQQWRRGLLLLLTFALILGALASGNLWELPSYWGIGVLALLVAQGRGKGRINWLLTGAVAVVYLVGAYLLYLPFFRHYVGVAASGVGLVKEGDDLGTWLLIWGFLAFLLLSWLLYTAATVARAILLEERETGGQGDREAGGQGDKETGGQGDRETGSAGVGELGHEGDEGTIGDEGEEASALDVLAEAGVAGAEDVALLEPRRQRIKPPGVERVLGLALAKYDQLPRLVYWHQRLVQQPTLGYLLALGVIPAAVLLALGAWLWGRTVLAFCLLPLGLGLLLLWRRSRAADAGTLFTTLLTVTGLTILAGTQVIFLKDFLAGGDWYRMNTIFKFFSQVWVMWGVAAAVAVPRIWQGWGKNVGRPPGMGRLFWGFCFALLLLMSLAYLIYGTPARLDMRMVGWRPPFGTLNGMEYMREGTYTWPDEQHRFELKYDREAIDWLLDHVRGNVVIVESDMVGYYREGGSRVATMTGLSGVRGMHESEQRYGEEVGQRDGLHHEFWATPDVGRTQQIMDELHVGLIYVGQLEQQQNPEGVQKISQMAANGLLTKLFANERTVIYAVPGRLTQTADGLYLPQ